MEKTLKQKTKSVKKAVTKKAAVKKSTVNEKPGVKRKYKVTLTMLDATFKSEGDTIEECLNQMRPTIYKSKGEFTVRCGKKKSVASLRPFQVKQLLLRPINQEIFSKRMISILK